MSKIKIAQITVAKTRPVQSAQLANNEKLSLPVGLEFEVPEIEVEQDHYKLTLYLFKGHCEVEREVTTLHRRINQAGLELIKQFEGLRTEAYLCPAGVWTIGYGSTLGVEKGDRISPESAELLLTKDLERFEKAVAENVRVPLTDNQFSALVCFAFNIGIGAFRGSTLLKLLNQQKYGEAADQLLRWNTAKGKVLEGLTRRRRSERALFLQY